MSVIIGIDIGGSTTKIVGFRKTENGFSLICPQFVRADDPITSIYGAFGKFTDENGLALSDIEKVMMTGVGSSYVKHGLYGLPTLPVAEFKSIGRGGLYLSGLTDALCVSMGTGTALVHAKLGENMKYLGGTGVGGGTLMGLSKLLLNAESVENIGALGALGNLKNIDLRISDISGENVLDELSHDLTASNFGNISDLAGREDVAAGILNMVFETVGMLSVFGARASGVKKIVLTGNLTQIHGCREKFTQFNEIYEKEGLEFIIPEHSGFATAIGTALCGIEDGRQVLV